MKTFSLHTSFTNVNLNIIQFRTWHSVIRGIRIRNSYVTSVKWWSNDLDLENRFFLSILEFRSRQTASALLSVFCSKVHAPDRDKLGRCEPKYVRCRIGNWRKIFSISYRNYLWLSIRAWLVCFEVIYFLIKQHEWEMYGIVFNAAIINSGISYFNFLS